MVRCSFAIIHHSFLQGDPFFGFLRLSCRAVYSLSPQTLHHDRIPGLRGVHEVNGANCESLTTFATLDQVPLAREQGDMFCVPEKVSSIVSHAPLGRYTAPTEDVVHDMDSNISVWR